MSAISRADNFSEKSREIAKNFLQSAVVLDDDIEILTDAVVPPVIEPTPFATESSDDVESTTSSRKGTLYTNTLTDAFADQGLVCSVLKAERNEDYKTRFVSVASRTDIIVLDWMIHDKPGDATLEIIDRILTEDQDQARTRLIAIYTVVDPIDQIKKGLKEQIQNYYRASETTESEFGMKKGPIQIVIINKNTTAEAQLPSLLVDEFSRMIVGLLPNVAVAGLAALRSNAHQLIAHFSEDMDPAYLGQRAGLPNPSEAEQHLIDALAGEMQAIMENRKVGNNAGSEAIGEWVRSAYASLDLIAKIKFKNPGGETESDIVDLVCAMLDQGWEDTKDRHNMTRREWGTQVFTESDEKAFEANKKFASLLSLKQRYLSPAPILWLGTIVSVEIEEESKYWLCVQPKCDSTNLKGNTPFPFLPLLAIDDDKFRGLSNCIVRDGPDYLLFKVSPRIRDLVTVIFDPVDGEIRTRTEGDQYFVDTDSKKYRWVSELKPQHAQRVANDIAAQTARVGLAESQWLSDYKP